jgi:hypothetical protein
MAEQRGESASPVHVRTWVDMEAATRIALEASAAFDKRKEAERRAEAESRGGAGRAPTAPGKEWVHP